MKTLKTNEQNSQEKVSDLWLPEEGGVLWAKGLPPLPRHGSS